MNLHVAAEVAPVVEVLATDRASGGELPGAAVDRHVVFEVAQLGKRLSAFSAGVPRGRSVAFCVHLQSFRACEYL